MDSDVIIKAEMIIGHAVGRSSWGRRDVLVEQRDYLKEEASSYRSASPASSRRVTFNPVDSKRVQSSYESLLVSYRKYFRLSSIIQGMLRP